MDSHIDEGAERGDVRHDTVKNHSGLQILELFHPLELALTDHVHEDIASKSFEHFLYTAEAMTNIGGDGIGLWDDEEEFYYDALHMNGAERVPLRVRPLVGLIALCRRGARCLSVCAPAAT